jgi:dUTP pyrophosphatase
MNVGDKIIGIKAGDRYAQGTVRPIWLVVFNEVETLPDSDRGAGGFGSTGV